MCVDWPMVALFSRRQRLIRCACGHRSQRTDIHRQSAAPSRRRAERPDQTRRPEQHTHTCTHEQPATTTRRTSQSARDRRISHDRGGPRARHGGRPGFASRSRSDPSFCGWKSSFAACLLLEPASIVAVCDVAEGVRMGAVQRVEERRHETKWRKRRREANIVH